MFTVSPGGFESSVRFTVSRVEPHGLRVRQAARVGRRHLAAAGATGSRGPARRTRRSHVPSKSCTGCAWQASTVMQWFRISFQLRAEAGSAPSCSSVAEPEKLIVWPTCHFSAAVGESIDTVGGVSPESIRSVSVVACAVRVGDAEADVVRALGVRDPRELLGGVVVLAVAVQVPLVGERVARRGRSSRRRRTRPRAAPARRQARPRRARSACGCRRPCT